MLFAFERFPQDTNMCLLCPKDQTNKHRVAEGWGGGIRSGTDAKTQEAWSSALTSKSSSSGLGRVFISLIANVSCLPWTPISVTSEVSVQGSDSTMSTPVNNRTSEYGAKCFLPPALRLLDLGQAERQVPYLVTCRCILKNDSRKNDTDIHKHKS